jgi:hypothetical protein
MSTALNLGEIIATLYLLAIIGALAYAAARAWWVKHGSTRGHRQHPALAVPWRH